MSFKNKKFKNLKKENLRENKKVAQKGGNAAKQARISIEEQTGESIVSGKKREILREYT